MEFNFKETAIKKALKWERISLIRVIFKISLFFCIITIPLFLVSFLISFSSVVVLRIFFFSLACLLATWEINAFFEARVKKPKTSFKLEEAVLNQSEYNLAELLDFDAAKIINSAIKFCGQKKIQGVSAMALLYASLDVSSQAEYIFLRLALDIEKLKHDIKNNLEKSERGGTSVSFTDDFNLVIEEALKSASINKQERIGSKDILVGISKVEFFKNILVEYNLKIEDFENLTLWLTYLDRKVEENKKFWDAENLAMHGSLAKDWAAGYTITLDKYAIDWRGIVKKWFFKAIIGHEQELEDLQAALIRPDANNALLIGDPGAGRDGIIEGLARRLYLGKGLTELNYFRVVELDMVSLLSQITDPEMVENTLDRIFQEVVTAGNIILTIKNFHNYVGLNVSQPGAVDISGIIGKYLSFPQFKFVATTDYNGLHTRIEKNPSMLEMFTKIEISEISKQETIRILQNMALELERKYKVFVTYPAIRDLVDLAERYMPSVPFPKKGVDLLQDVVVYVARSAKQKVVLPADVAKIVSSKTSIPVGKVEKEEKTKLLNLEKLIHDRIVNQEEAVKEISIAMRRARAGIGSKKRPMGTFLFLGPTGVGKTETSKALSQIYFDSEDKMIRLDMSEFQAVSDIKRLIGAPGEEGVLTTPVREKPFALVLLDEIEKAHPNILNLFLQVLDEGYITDGQNRKTLFTNTIIICTSNAGADMIFSSVEKGESVDKENLLTTLFDKGLFRPEFVNRFDATVIFKPLTKKNLLDIAQISLNSLKKNLKEKEIDFIITEPLKESIVELSYKPAFGAREMRRVIQNKVESAVAEALLSDEIKKGQSFEISAKDFQLIIK